MRGEFRCDNQELMQTVIDAFKSENPKRKCWGNFRIVENLLLYRFCKAELIYTNKPGEATKSKIVNTVEENIIARRTSSGKMLANAEILPLIGQYSSYGTLQVNRHQTVIQRLLSEDRDFVTVPFNVFREAELDLDSFKVIEWGGSETVKRKYPNNEYDPSNKHKMEKAKIPKHLWEDVHFIGAMVFQVGPKYFLFDIDRVEIKHGTFNPFLVQMPKKVQTVDEAYAALKPKVVVEAERDGKKVLRQGEWFFIPTKGPKVKKLTELDKVYMYLRCAGPSVWGPREEQLIAAIGKKKVNAIRKKAEAVEFHGPVTLRAGKNRPNEATLGVIIGKRTLVTGTIKHTGREHQDLKLPGWYEAVCNTALTSHTIMGDID